MSANDLSSQLQAATLKACDELIVSLGGERPYAICLQTSDDGMSVGLCANTEEAFSRRRAFEAEYEDMTAGYVAYLRWAPGEWRYEMFGDAHFALINRDLSARSLNAQTDFDLHFASLIEAMNSALANLRAAKRSVLEGVTMFVTISDSDAAEHVERESVRRLNPPALASTFAGRPAS